MISDNLISDLINDPKALSQSESSFTFDDTKYNPIQCWGENNYNQMDITFVKQNQIEPRVQIQNMIDYHNNQADNFLLKGTQDINMDLESVEEGIDTRGKSINEEGYEADVDTDSEKIIYKSNSQIKTDKIKTDNNNSSNK